MTSHLNVSQRWLGLALMLLLATALVYKSGYRMEQSHVIHTARLAAIIEPQYVNSRNQFIFDKQRSITQSAFFQALVRRQAGADDDDVIRLIR